MDQDVALGLVADDEAEAAGGVEPFDRAGEVEQLVVGRLRARGAPRSRRSRHVPLGTRFPTRRHLRLTPLIRR